MSCPVGEGRTPVQSLGQVFGAVSVGQRRVFLLQEGVLVPDGIGHGLPVVNVQLAPANVNECGMKATRRSEY